MGASAGAGTCTRASARPKAAPSLASNGTSMAISPGSHETIAHGHG